MEDLWHTIIILIPQENLIQKLMHNFYQAPTSPKTKLSKRFRRRFLHFAATLGALFSTSIEAALEVFQIQRYLIMFIAYNMQCPEWIMHLYTHYIRKRPGSVVGIRDF